MQYVAVLIAAAIVIFIVIAAYNTLVAKRNQVDNAFAMIDTQLKKRCDLIPNLVSSVQAYMKHESETLTKIASLRAEAVKPDLPPEKRVELDGALSGMMRNILVQVENYPELKASDSFLQLNRSLNEVEEQLSAARRSYNAAVTDYNTGIQSFPMNIFAGIFHFTKRELLEISEAERATPNVGELFRK